MMKADKGELPKGFTCSCGEYHRYTEYVYAHWREALHVTCEACKTVWHVYAGVPSILKGKGKR